MLEGGDCKGQSQTTVLETGETPGQGYLDGVPGEPDTLRDREEEGKSRRKDPWEEILNSFQSPCRSFSGLLFFW